MFLKHDMLPQHLVCKYELNCEYCNIPLARDKAPRMMIWQDRNISEFFKMFLKVFYMKLYVHSLVDKLKYYSALQLGVYNRFQIVLHVSALFLAM